METADPRSIPEVISAVASDLANLVRKEGELVRTEVTEKIHDAAKAGTSIGIGSALLLGGFGALIAALILGLSKFMDPFWAALLVGVVFALIGFTLVRGAAEKVKGKALAPERAARQIQKDAQLVKGQVQ